MMTNTDNIDIESKAFYKRETSQKDIARDKNSNEFILGRGFTNRSNFSSSKKVFENIINLAGCIIIGYLLCEHLLNFFIAKIFGMFIPSISVNLFTGNVSIVSDESFILMIFLTILKFTVAFLILKYGFKYKFYGLKFNKKAEKASSNSIIFSFGLTAICAGIISLLTLIPKIYHTTDYISTVILNNSNFLFDNVVTNVSFIFIWTVIISAFIENIIHSSLFRVAKQLNGNFAVFYLATLSVFMVQGFSLIIPMFIISIFLGYSVLRTNSAVISTIQRIIISCIAMIVYYLNISSTKSANLAYILAIASICIVLGIILIAVANVFNKNQHSVSTVESQLKTPKFSSLIYAFHNCTPCLIVGTTFVVVLFLVGCFAGVNSGL